MTMDSKEMMDGGIAFSSVGIMRSVLKRGPVPVSSISRRTKRWKSPFSWRVMFSAIALVDLTVSTFLVDADLEVRLRVGVFWAKLLAVIRMAARIMRVFS